MFHRTRGTRAVHPGTWGALGLIAILPVIPLPGVTQLEGGRASLQGLPGVAVLAEEVAGDVRPYGVDQEWLAGQVTRALGRNGLGVLTTSDALSRPRQPLLVARIQTVKLPGRRAFAWHSSLALHQSVVVQGTDAPPVLAVTWEASAIIGVTSGTSLRSSLSESIDRQVAELARAWRAPKE